TLQLLRFAKIIMSSSDTVAKLLLSLAIGAFVWYGIFMAFEPIYSTYHIPILIGMLWGITASRFHAVAIVSTKRRRKTSLFGFVHSGIALEANVLAQSLAAKDDRSGAKDQSSRQ